MATSWCPQCRSEYREGFTECADCGVALVPERPEEPARDGGQQRPAEPAKLEDEPVELMRINAVEAELIASHLRDAGIPTAVLAIGTAAELVAVQFSEGSRVMVGRSDLAAARAALADLSIDASDLEAQAEAATDRSDPGSGAVV